MANVKVPALLHKMSVASQKAWYKKNNMELPGHLTGKEGKSAAQAKKDVGEINKQKAKEKTSLQKALETSPKQKELKKSSERVRQMASNALAFGGQRPGGDLTTARGMVNYIRSGGTLRAGRLGEAAKPDASMAMTDQLKKKMITDKDKQTLGKVATLMASAKNKDKKNEYVRQLGLKAMKAGKVDPARGHIPTRAGREELKKEGFDPEPADIAAHLVKKHGKGKVTSKHLDAYEGDRDTRRGLDREEIMKHVKKLSEETVNEVSKAEAEKVLGGAVKEKPKMPPGKQPAGYRYVRGLARKAMKAGLKKEEVEVIETPEVVVEQDDSMEKKEMAQTQLHFMAYAAKEILEFIDMGGEIEEWYQNKLSKVQSEVESLHSYIEGEKRRTGMVKEEEQIDEKAPPGAKYERMVKHIKSQYAKDGLTGKEKAIAYATAWKAYGKKEEVETVEEQEVMKHGTKGGSTPEQKAKDYDEKWDRYKNAKKPANEEVEQVEERYVGFKKLKAKIAAKGGARNPAAVAAAIGRKKYGKEKFQAAAAAGKKLAKEEVVVEAEGAEPTTPREKTLAAKHGDPKKITYGDVIKARIQSAKEKALKGKE